MRKVLSLLLCVALLCSLVVISVQADGGAALSVANAVAIPGSTVVLDININSNPGLTAVKLKVTDVDGLGATYAGATTITTSQWAFTPNDAKGIYVWYGPTAVTTVNFGTLAITIPDEAEAGVYHFTLASGTGDDQAVNGETPVDIATAEFTITVTNKAITGVNVAIDTGLAIGVHVLASDTSNTSITAVDVTGKEFITVTDFDTIYVDPEAEPEELEPTGEYVYYLNVNPWDLDKVFTVDFTVNFAIADDVLDLDQLPSTAKTISILDYCKAIQGTSEKLDQLIADMLEFGRQAQIYNGAEEPSYDLPAGLSATDLVGAEEFGASCDETGPESINAGNKTAKLKFVFDSVTIEVGAKFVATFNIANGSTATDASYARMIVNGTTYGLSTDDLDPESDTVCTFTYAFNPTEVVDGVDFILYGNGDSTTNSNKCWTNNYGPVNYAAYVYEEEAGEAGDAILAILEAYYNYGVSVADYVGE